MLIQYSCIVIQITWKTDTNAPWLMPFVTLTILFWRSCCSGGKLNKSLFFPMLEEEWNYIKRVHNILNICCSIFYMFYTEYFIYIKIEKMLRPVKASVSRIPLFDLKMQTSHKVNRCKLSLKQILQYRK